MKTKYIALLLTFLACCVAFGQNNNAWQQQQRMQDQQRMQEQQRRMQEQQRMDQQRRMEEMQRQRAQQMEQQRRQQQEAMRQQQEAARRQQQLQQQQMRDRQMSDQRQRQTAQMQQRMQQARTNGMEQQRRNIAGSLLKSKQPQSTVRQAAPSAQSKSIQPAKTAALKASVKASVDKAKLAITQKKTAQAIQETGRMKSEIRRLQGKTQMLRTKLQTLIKTQQAQAKKISASAALAKNKGLVALQSKIKANPPKVDKPKPKGEICFVAGTLVKTEHGLRSIENIRIGDLVWSRDERTSDEGWKSVVQLFTTHPTELVHLTYLVSGDTTPRTLSGTAIHPFWSEDRQEWVNMTELTIGEALSTNDGNGHAVVTRIEHEIAPIGTSFTTFNFEVADWHTYFVAPKNSPPRAESVWVHNQNKGFCKEGLARIKKGIDERGAKYGERVLAAHKNLPAHQVSKIKSYIHAAKANARLAAGQSTHSKNNIRYDYSKDFAEDRDKFTSNHTVKHFSAPLKKDLILVQYHDKVPLGSKRSVKWWTSVREANLLSDKEKIHQRLGLSPEWGKRVSISVARIPKGTIVEYMSGTAAKQDGKDGSVYIGGGVQYRFKEFNSDWIVETEDLP